MMLSLTDSQSRAVSSDAKYLLINAGAGSGKTRVLTCRMIRKIRDSKKGKKVIGITFSNKAAEELQERVEKELQGEDLSSLAAIGTLHSFFAGFLRERIHMIGLSNDFQIISEKDEEDLIGNILLELNSGQTITAKEKREKREDIGRLKRKFLEPSDCSDGDLKGVYAALDNRLHSLNLIDFDDILRYSHLILESFPAVGSIYRRLYWSIFIDEGQDLNYPQYETIRLFAGEDMEITIVGDPKQSIYGFQGSSSHYMTEDFVKTFSPSVIDIEDNFRSSSAVIGVAQAFGPDYSPRINEKNRGHIVVKEFPNEYWEARFIADEIRRIGGWDRKNFFAVLARNRSALGQIKETLTDSGISFTEKTPSIKELLFHGSLFRLFGLGLQFLVNPNNSLHWGEASDCLEALHLPLYASFTDLVSDKQDNELISCVKTAWIAAWNDGRQSLLNKSLMQLRKCLPLLTEDEQKKAERDVSDFKHLLRIFGKVSDFDHQTLNDFLTAVSLGKLDGQDMQGVILSTVHASKGLEFDTVFIVGMHEGGFPDFRALRSARNGDNSDFEQEEHSMFVAITRAKTNCYFTYPKKIRSKYGGRCTEKDVDESSFLKRIKAIVDFEGNDCEK